ncbi:hypothetical protein DWX43_17030 [Clostridium sp. AF19-22AC]|uniref:hypothetical protein n=1 Tax=Clostridia TaxID=186801 RepID=UPI000E552D78|nr:MULTISPECIES: hypothetical protein [Clostridia]RHR25829.1 hypothetical protein DWX43_17030 [Clostridium sp. AF19-22AC]
MGLTEIGEQYNSWLLMQITQLKKKCRRGSVLLICLSLTNLICIAAIIWPKPREASMINISVKIPTVSIEKENEITCESSILVTNQTAGLMLHIPSEKKGKYQVSLYIEEKLVYQSEELYPGTAVSAVTLTKQLKNGEYQGEIVIQNVKDTKEKKMKKAIKVYCFGKTEGQDPQIVEGGRG